MARYLLPIIVFAALIPVFLIGLDRDPSELPSPLINKAAPDFELPTLFDAQTTLSNSDYQGQMTLINVWATWCVGCRQEHEFLLQLARQNVIPIYGLNWRDRRDDAIQWLTELGNPYVESGFDADGRVGIDWGVYGAPETFLISPDGVVLHKHLGPLDATIWTRDFVPRITGLGDSES